MKNFVYFLILAGFGLPLQVYGQYVFLNEFMPCNISAICDEDGDYPDWIELYNGDNEAVNLEGFSLTDDRDDLHKWTFPDIELPARDFLIIFASGKDRRQAFSPLHANFSIRNAGEELFLTSPDNFIYDHLESGSLTEDISIGRIPDGGRQICTFEFSTPGESNGIFRPPGRVCPPEFSLPAGFYQDFVRLSISHEDSTAVIYFTTDGSIPTERSKFYVSPLFIYQTTIVRSTAIVQGMQVSHPATGTFFINYEPSLPVISITAEPENLWGEDRGIYIEGPNAAPDPPHYGANYWQNWEAPAFVEYFETEHNLGFSQDAGLKIYGGVSRQFPQKSLRVIAYQRAGNGVFNYDLFPNIPIHSYPSFTLRNAGNDWHQTLIRDPLLSGLVDSAGVGVLAYQPTVVFINGEYWGIHNMRERFDETYLAAHYGVDPENIDLIANWTEVEAGDLDAVNQLLEYLGNHDLDSDAAYEEVCSMVDIENYIRYLITEIYIGNSDWPINNVCCWRPRVEGARLQWLLFDLDYGFGFRDSCDCNFVDRATSEQFGSFTLLLRKCLENDSFRQQFIVRFCDFINTVFEPEHAAEEIAACRDRIEDELPNHSQRWCEIRPWNRYYNGLTHYAQHRRENVYQHLQDKFDLREPVELTLTRTPSAGGRFLVNSVHVDDRLWHGSYFPDFPIKIQALPHNGYRFAGWNGDINDQAAEITIYPGQGMRIIANFELQENQNEQIVITEINYHSTDDFNPGDWFEVYALRSDIDLGNWTMSDESNDHYFVCPPGTEIHEGDYLIFVEDSAAFKGCFPDAENFIGDLGFGLGNEGDQVRLFNSAGVIMDSVCFDDEAPWHFMADGHGPTLQLTHPEYANEWPENWGVSLEPHGDPGSLNRAYGIRPDNRDGALPEDAALFSLYPNPFNSILKIHFNGEDIFNGSLNIYDINGGLAKRIDTGGKGGLGQVLTWDATTFASGIYLITASSGGRFFSRKALLLR